MMMRAIMARAIIARAIITRAIITRAWDGLDLGRLDRCRFALCQLVVLALAVLASAATARAETAPRDPAVEIFGPPMPPVLPDAPARPVIARDRSVHSGLVREEALRRGMPPALADAVARVESGYDPTAVSEKGAIGLMQVMPGTARLLGFDGPPGDLFVPATNIRLGVTYLAQAWTMTDGSVCRTVMKYYAGHRRERMFPDAVTYCRRVVAILDESKFPVPKDDRDLVEGAGGPLAIGRGYRPRGRPVAYAMRSARLRKLLPVWLTNAKITPDAARAAVASNPKRYKTLPALSIMVGN